MGSRLRGRSLVALAALVAGLIPAVGAPAATDPAINEIRIDQPGTDVDEYFELAGDPNGSLDGLTYVVIGDGTGGSGVIEAVVDLSGQSLDGDGLFVAAESTFNLGSADLTTDLNFENSDNVTHLLVRGFTGADGDDLDTDDDGILDTTPWSAIVDSVALIETVGSGDLVYSSTQVGPDGSFVPGHVFLCADGWRIGAFGGGQDTPGAANACTAPDVTHSISDIQFTTDPGGASPEDGNFVVTTGVVTAVEDGGDAVWIQDGEGPWNGLFLFSPSAAPPVGTEVVVSGTVSEFFGLTEIAFGAVFVVGPADVPEPALLPTGEVGSEQWEGVFVAVTDVTVTDEDLGFGEWLVDDGSGGIRVDDLGSYAYTPAAGDELLLVQGPLHYAFGNFKIEPRTDGDIGSNILTISQIQGSGQYSPVEGQVVATAGVVTATDRFGGRDLWIQDSGDGDPATSDGILVNDAGDLADLAPGDMVYVIGQVEEQQFGTALPRTRIDDVTAAVRISSGNALPNPVGIRDLPNVSILDGIAFWEPLEGMRVEVRNATIVSPTSGFGEFAMVTNKDRKKGSGFEPSVKQIVIRSLGGDQVDYNPERILVDDTTAVAPDVRPGDQVKDLVGVVDYTFGNYKLQPTASDLKIHDLPRRVPVSKRSGGEGDLSITTYNVENLFDLVDTPGKDDIGTGGAGTLEELETQLAKLTRAFVDELETPAIVIVQEVENQAILQTLGDRINAESGTSYVATSFETSDGRGIEVGFLWDAARVDLVEAFQLDDTIVPDVSTWFGPSSPSPGREPLVGVFDIGGETVTIVGNHLKSKRGDDPLFGVNWPPVRVSEVQRKGQARVVRSYVDLVLDADPEALVIVAGDMNDFQFAEPGEGADHPLAILEGGPGQVPLTNLVLEEKPAERWTFIFDGNSQVLDHFLVSPALEKRVRGVDILHFDASYPAALSEDPTTAIRASDHDPVEVRFDWEPDDD